MKAIVLVGGFGTRLQSLGLGVPKPLASVDDRPFLEYVINNLENQGFTEINLCTHYLSEQIADYCKKRACRAAINIIYEHTPLGTGGAILNALNEVKDRDIYFLINGDTFIDVDFRAIYNLFVARGDDLGIVLKEVEDARRYGSVDLGPNSMIIGFTEKNNASLKSLINAGVYLADSAFLKKQLTEIGQQTFSFEEAFLKLAYNKFKIAGYPVEGYFIDIGVPEDYALAQKVMGKYL